MIIKKKLRFLVSVQENKNFYKSLIIKKKYLDPFFNNDLITTNRQRLNKIYSPNGAIYIFYSRDIFKNKKLLFNKAGYYLMNTIDSIDIDNKEDYELAKILCKKYIKLKKN